MGDIEDMSGSLGGAGLAAVLRCSFDAIVLLDAAGTVVEFNPAAERTFGYPAADAKGREVCDLVVPPGERRRLRSTVARLLAGGGPAHGRSYELRVMRAGGEVFPAEASVTEIGSTGERLFAVCLRDLSEYRALQEAHRTSEVILDAFMENAPVGMYVKDAGGRYLLANPEMHKVFGRPSREVIGRTAADIFHSDEAAMIARHDRQILESRQPTAVVEHLPDQDDFEWSLVVRFPVTIEGVPAMIGGFDIDITAQKRAEEELRRSRDALHQTEKLSALGSLLAGVSHELNNPLAIVVGEAILLEEEAEGTEHAAGAARIRRSAERCSRIVQIFLAMARQKTPERAPHNVNEAARSAVEMTAYAMRTNCIEVQCDFADGLPAVAADRDQLQQVLVNLLVNAQQALQEVTGSRRIVVSTGVGQDDRVFVRVADNGPGVEVHTAGRIFEPFFTTKPVGAGTGLGLSFSHGVIEAHGGTLTLEEAPRGASFLISLPAMAGFEARESLSRDAPPAAGAKGRALVIDDEPELAAALGKLLAREGYGATTALSGASAIEAMAAGDFDVILSDLRMPEADGLAVHRWVAANRPSLLSRLGFVTGDTLGPAAARFLAESGRPFIEKPFTRDSIRALLAQLGPGADG